MGTVEIPVGSCSSGTQIAKFTGPILFRAAAGATRQRALTCVAAAAQRTEKGAGADMGVGRDFRSTLRLFK